MVHHHKRRLVGSLDHNLSVGPESGVPYAKQMVPPPPGDLQRGLLLVPRIVQNCLSDVQCRSLRSFADRRIKVIV